MKPVLVSFFIFLALIFGTQTMYNNWVESQENLQFDQVVSLKNSSKVVTLSAPNGQRLVPTGAIMAVGDVNEVVYTYLVEIEEDAVSM